MPTALRYGLIGALLLVAVDLLSRVTGMQDPSDPSKAMTALIFLPVNWAILIGTFLMAIKKHREDLGGFITFGRAFTVAFMTGLVIAVITLIWTYVYLAVIDPSILEQVQAVMEDQIPEDNPAAGFLSTMQSPGFMAGSAFLSRIFSALIFGLIAGGIGQRKDPNA